MKRNIKNPKAFSLIELSIVILIVGIVIAGVTQASRLVGAFKLSSARNFTQNSAVASIKGLILWLEPTLEKSFISAEADDETNLTTWYDINPQSTTKYNFTRGTSDNTVTYEANGANNLPTVEYAGGVTASLSGTAVASEYNAFTFFIVAKTNDNSSSTWREVFSYGGWGYQKKDTNRRNISFYGITDSSDTTSWSLNNEIASVVYYGTANSNTVKLYVNGGAKTVSPSTSAVNTGTAAAVGTGAWLGTISEVILFDRALKISERQDIEAYLGKKYGITVTQAN